VEQAKNAEKNPDFSEDIKKEGKEQREREFEWWGEVDKNIKVLRPYTF